VPGDVSAVDGSTPAVVLGAGGASVGIATRSAASEVYLGDALFLGATDWRIDFTGLAAGDTFRITFSPVSAPAPLALLLAGLGLAAFARRR